MIEDKFDLTYYSGTDLYSDGDVENELLEAVGNKEISIEEQLIAGDSWPHLYHLSNVRENILDWYDFDPKGSLLEIGSGCGALTGLFCRKVDHVVAIELSKRRSMINATRNEQYNNLKIMLGNFEDIKITEKFDYVTLIGVFEYSICYINSENPFMDMLKRARSFLKPGGKLFIAIENKYGLKYFSGASEDHSGRLFDGIENYATVDRVRTFSRKTLEKMLVCAGFEKNDFYYPMPDYKLPSEIYSDARMPSFGSVRSACTAYDRDRYELFDERLAFDALAEDGMFPDMANSFLVVSENPAASENSAVSEDLQKSSRVIYAKYNRMRAPQYQIGTRIVEECRGTEVVRKVYKEALRKEAYAHIDNLRKNYEKLASLGGNVCPIPIHSCGEGRVEFPYVKGESLAGRVNAALGNWDHFLARMHEVMAMIYGAAGDACSTGVQAGNLTDFAVTDTFEEVFGKASFIGEDGMRLLGTMKCCTISNVDSILSNFMVEEETKQLKWIDYEWVWDCPIPVDYLKYRTLYYYYSENQGYLLHRISLTEYLEEFGIDESQAAVFARMEDNYQQYVHGKDRKYMYMSHYGKRVTNIGKNFQNDEPWFKSIMKDLNEINHTMGPHRRDLVTCHIKMHRKSEFVDRWKNRITHPGRTIKNFLAKFGR